FVAKEVNYLGGKGKVTSRQAKHALLHEIKRLELARWALDRFKAHAREMDVPLGGCSFEGKYDEVESGDVDGSSIHSTGVRHFLVEPLRSTTAVIKFSGTLGSRAATDGLSGTITAFAHYAAQILAAKRVFCDLQGSHHRSASGTTFVLFDPMTHSISGDSGPGDHGFEGVQSFIKTHRCSEHCKRLQLAAKSRLSTSATSAAKEQDAIDFPPL
ncbi:hypothetical protein M407DRAFT_84669, partial [Tulasnella calospora MUT 4182]